jgi:hypothetical protein
MNEVIGLHALSKLRQRNEPSAHRLEAMFFFDTYINRTIPRREILNSQSQASRMASKIPSHEAVGVLENDEIKQINLGTSRDDELEEAPGCVRRRRRGRR